MKIIKRKYAKQLGLQFYFTGKPCPSGHKSKRYVSNASCWKCHPRKSDLDIKTWQNYLDSKRIRTSRCRAKLRQRVLNILGACCIVCGNSDSRVLQTDHRYGGGRLEYKNLGTYKVLHEILLEPQNYQLLCANCNCIKAIENKEFGSNIINDAPKDVIRWRRASRNLRQKVFNLLGHRCFKCGNGDKRCLQIDHLLGGGGAEFRLLGWKGVCRNALKNPDYYQILCANCNWIKRYINKEVAYADL
jgi:hypothetical protein